MRRLLLTGLLAALTWTLIYGMTLRGWGDNYTGLRCEGYGCLGQGLLYVVLQILSVIAFALGAAGRAPKGQRSAWAAQTALIFLLVLGVASGVQSGLHKAKIREEMARACADDPEMYAASCRDLR